MNELESIKEELKNIGPELTRKFHVSSIGLFGSVVRNDFSNKNSDLDILVDFSRPVGIEFIDLADYLESRFQRKVDLVTRKGLKPGYIKHIENELIYVYKAA